VYHPKKQANEKSDSSSFAEPGSLVRMNHQNESSELWSGNQNNQDDLCTHSRNFKGQSSFVE
jgi:hypothetical protein